MFEDSLAPRTRFDLNFRVGDVPVRVHPFFWLSTVLLGWEHDRQGPDKLIYLLIWIGVAFVSILAHEMGHILMGRWFGRRGHILLTGFCGLAIGSAELPERWQRNAVSLAGPGAGFLLGALIAGLTCLYNPMLTLALLGDVVGVTMAEPVPPPIPSRYVVHALFGLIWINLFWGLLNLLPIWPLDGGQVCRESCEHYRGRDGLRVSLMISIGTAATFAAIALFEFIRKKPLIPFLSLGDSLFPVLFFGLLAFSNWQLLQFIRRHGSEWQREQEEPLAPWEQDADWWKRGDRPWND